MCQGAMGSINSHYFPYIRWGANQPKPVGIYMPLLWISVTKGWDDHPQYKELIDPGTYYFPQKNGGENS